MRMAAWAVLLLPRYAGACLLPTRLKIADELVNMLIAQPALPRIAAAALPHLLAARRVLQELLNALGQASDITWRHQQSRCLVFQPVGNAPHPVSYQRAPMQKGLGAHA